ncbi:hypothetical protein V2G26_000408 [Clonostachys chloroleuca]
MTERTSGRGRVSKRSDNACSRCRKQKIKCSGSHPCDACQKRKVSCEFDSLDQKVLVTRGYLLQLQRQTKKEKQDGFPDYATPASADLHPGQDSTNVNEESSELATRRPVSETRSSESRENLDPIASTLTNPMSTGKSKFMKSAEGRIFYLGTSSTWSFSRRIMSLTHEYVHGTPIAPTTLLFDGSAYDLGWDGARVNHPFDHAPLPSLDHAIFLINNVKFHCSQLFHLFDEESFMKYLYDYYSHPTPKTGTPDLQFIHLLVILAMGKALGGSTFQSDIPPGSEYFVMAIQRMPSFHALFGQPILLTEVLCCIALYFQCLDHRHASHAFIGEAIRMALGQGMHTDMPQDELGADVVERSRKAWWTAYLLDRQMTSLMGVPQSIHDDDVHSQLPDYADSPQRRTALAMQIRLSRTMCAINKGVYGTDGRLNKRFLIKTKEVLSGIADLTDELQQKFPMQANGPFSTISRTSGYLHLLYHQCIILATRPLLFCFMKIQFESPDTYLESLNSSQTVRSLIKMCIDSSQQCIKLLDCLLSQGLLASFLTIDLDPLFASSLNLLIGPAIDYCWMSETTIWRERAYAILNEMIGRGNRIAKYRLAELEQLADMLSHLPQESSPQTYVGSDLEAPAAVPVIRQLLVGPPPILAPGMPPLAPAHMEDTDDLTAGIPNLEECYMEEWLSPGQITAMANSIGNSDSEWLSNTMTEHDIF